MDKNTRALAYLLGVQFQALMFLGVAWYGAEHLDKAYPSKSFDWIVITLPVALLVIGHSFYAVFRFLVKKDSKRTEK